eukprot:UN22947
MLQANNISVEMIDTFPPEDINSSCIFVVDSKKFFDGDILSYNLDLYNVFIDDLQTVTNSSIKDFVDTQYTNACRTNKYFWVCNDTLQNPNPRTEPLDFSIPRKELTKMLRNSSNIIPLVMEMRKDAMDLLSHDATMFPEVKPGHNIAGAPVILHQLEDVSSNDDRLSFEVQMVRQE